MPHLRQAIADKMQRFYQLSVDADDEVTIFSGGTEALCSSILGLVEPDDEVIVFEPCYDSYPPSVAMAGATLRRIALSAPDWKLDPKILRAAFSEKTKLVVVNTPMNPCGKVFDRTELSLIAELCLEVDALVLCDEVYAHLCYDGACHVPMITLPGMRERTVCISSTAKTFSMTGWKIGSAVAGPEVTRAIRSSHQFVTFCTPPFLQEAMAEAIAMDDSYYTELLQGYADRRTYLCRRLPELGFAVTPPQDTYYIAADISGLGFDDDDAFCRTLPARTGVAVLPISAFYQRLPPGPPVVRIAFCKNAETLEEACHKLERLGQAGS